MEKTYTTISSANITMTLKVNNTETVIKFVGGTKFPKFKSGKYTTSNKDIQNAMENTNGYNIEYKLEKQAVQKQKKQSETKVITEVTNKQMAIEWINNKFKKKFNAEQSDSEIKDYLQSEGYIMINWK